MKIFFLLICFTGALNVARGQKAELSGHLELDSTWRRIIYVSRIPDFNSMYSSSDKLIVAQSAIDSAGNFRLHFSATNEETLYRIHITKNNDPVSTLIIGSNDENHVFFVAKGLERIFLNCFGTEKIIEQRCLTGSNQVDELNTLLNTLRSNLPRQELKDSLVTLSSKSSSELVSLLAVHSTFALDKKQKQKIKNALEKFDGMNGYGSKIFPEYLNDDRRYTNGLIIFAFVLIGGIFSYRIYMKRKIKKLNQLLSHREISIVQSILDGKTNKEIANELNIELSTIKTHVNNIYAKLKVGSRKELFKYKEFFKVPGK
jgi:DNA-binding CsgD family transcriptional regulator